VVVSHDRYFLDRTVDRLFSFEDGELKRFEGNYSAYLERVAASAQTGGGPATEREEPSRRDPGPAAPGAQGTRTTPRRRSFKENRELEELERRLPQWEERRAQLEAELTAGDGADYGRLETLTQELAALVERIHRGEERWLELSDRPA
jgi:ATP-binding cassette subfamily F protein uup